MKLKKLTKRKKQKLLDKFAGQAMAALIAFYTTTDPYDVAMAAYDYADAMLGRRRMRMKEGL